MSFPGVGKRGTAGRVRLRRRTSAQSRGAIAALVTGAVVSSLLGAAPTSKNSDHRGADIQSASVGKAEPLAPKRKKVNDPTIKAAQRTHDSLAKGFKWPSPGAATATVPTSPGKNAQAGDLPVRVGAPKGNRSEKGRESSNSERSVPSKAQVEILKHKVAESIGIDGVLLTVGRKDGNTAGGSLSVTLDYSSFANAYGGD